MYAVIASGGKQHRVSPGETVRLERLPGAEGDSVTFDQVLLVSNDDGLTVGAPTVAGATVTGTITTQGRGRKIVVGTYKRRKGTQRRLGHRQHYTLVEITDISG